MPEFLAKESYRLEDVLPQLIDRRPVRYAWCYTRFPTYVQYRMRHWVPQDVFRRLTGGELERHLKMEYPTCYRLYATREEAVSDLSQAIQKAKEG